MSTWVLKTILAEAVILWRPDLRERSTEYFGLEKEVVPGTIRVES